jgi:hypothetical protein
MGLSPINNSTLLEDTTTPHAPEIATTDENLSVDNLFQQTLLPSLGKQIFSVIPVNGPTAALFNIRKKKDANDFELLRSEVEVYPSQSITTNVTQEVIQDLFSQYGREAEKIIGSLLRGLANDDENQKTLAFLEANSATAPDVVLSDSHNAEVNLFEITQKVHELVLLINNKTLRTFESWAVVPYQPLGGLMGLTGLNIVNDENERGLYITTVGQTRFYLNPDVNSTTVYVGLKDPNNPSKSSAVFSPYRSSVVEASNPNTGDNVYHIFNRYAITLSPLHETGNELLYKFNITR